jgi:hypothetical protein
MRPEVQELSYDALQMLAPICRPGQYTMAELLRLVLAHDGRRVFQISCAGFDFS